MHAGLQNEGNQDIYVSYNRLHVAQTPHALFSLPLRSKSPNHLSVLYIDFANGWVVMVNASP